jgi:succinyl-diaminopimelate desuccinylase
MSIDRAVRGLEPRLVEFTKRLVSIPTVNPPGKNYENIVALIEQRCKSLGLSTNRVRVPASELKAAGIDSRFPRLSLLAGWDTGSDKTLHMNCHFDVVPVTSFWKTDPFVPVVKQGRLYGRGSSDMKSDIAAMLGAIEALKSQGIVPSVNIQLSFVPDEETGGRLGFGYLVRKGLVKADYIIGEGHYGTKVSCGNKGLLWLKVEVIGKASHAAYAYKGVNAFEHAAALAVDLARLKQKVIKRASRYNFSDKRQKNPTLVIGGLLEGGSKTNTVPDRVVFSIDRRVLPDEDIESAKQEILSVIRAYCSRNPKIKIRVTVGGADKPVLVDTGSGFARTFSKAIRHVYGKPVQFNVLSGGTDIRFMLYKGIPGLGYSADGENIHADDEYVKVKSIVQTTRVFAYVLAGMKRF